MDCVVFFAKDEILVPEEGSGEVTKLSLDRSIRVFGARLAESVGSRAITTSLK